MRFCSGRHVFGLAAITYGVIAMVWHRVDSLGGISQPGILVYVVAMLELIGGIALQLQRTVKVGAVVLCVVFSIFSLYLVPPIVAKPLVFGYWGNFLEKLSMLIGGVFVLLSTIPDHREKTSKAAKAAYICFGICVFSFALYQLFYLTYTARLVPKWIPPGQMFWAVSTTIAFALAALAMLSGRSALLASVLLTAMLIGFGVLIWVPACVHHPHVMGNWTENAENLAIAGSAWIVAEYLWKKRSTAEEANRAQE